MIPSLFIIPALAGVAAFFIRPHAIRRFLLLATAILHATLTTTAWIHRPASAWNGCLQLDAIGLLFLSITSALFLVVVFYAFGHVLGKTSEERGVDLEEGFLFDNTPEAVFTGGLLLFLAMMTLVTISAHFGLLWVAVEATTLSSAPLIYFHRHHRSLEATWKYLLICSVGIALALIGNFCLAAACSSQGQPTSLFLEALLGRGSQLNPSWLKTAFIFMLVGYGTKMGLAPMHTWLPDAHSEAPSVVSALLSGALLNCAFLAILRMTQVCIQAGCGDFSRELLRDFGLLSMAFAAVFMIGQLDYKRMLAYSSVEHIGILAFGVGLGSGGIFGAMLHAVNHSLTKGMLFLLAGNILAVYQSKSCREVQGVRRLLPITGLLWLAGFLAITGTPPFGTFLSELTILKAALDTGHGIIAVVFLSLLAVIFIAMSINFLMMSQGAPPTLLEKDGRKEALLTIAPPAALGLATLILGLYMPLFITNVLGEASRILGGG